MQRRKIQIGVAELDLSDACRDLLSDLQKRINRVATGKGKEEDVHKFRTACRRIEAVLTQVLHAANSNDLKKIYQDVRRARKKAGEVRDIDVAIDLVKTVALPLDCPTRAGCTFLDRYLSQQRGKLMKRLERAVRERRIAILMERLKEIFRGITLTDVDVRDVLVGCIAETRELAARVQTPEALHHTRLSLKRLRDVAIVVGPVFGKKAQAVADRAGKLCDQLGKSQDLVTLVGLIDDASGEPDAPRELVELRKRLQEKHDKSHAISRRGIADVKSLERLVASVN